MKIFINQEEISIDAEASLESFLTNNNFNQNGIAVAINNNVIPKNKWDEYLLKENDQITLIRATAGG